MVRTNEVNICQLPSMVLYVVLVLVVVLAYNRESNLSYLTKPNLNEKQAEVNAMSHN